MHACRSAGRSSPLQPNTLPQVLIHGILRQAGSTMNAFCRTGMAATACTLDALRTADGIVPAVHGMGAPAETTSYHAAYIMKPLCGSHVLHMPPCLLAESCKACVSSGVE